jgi:hypothetical protein
MNIIEQVYERLPKDGNGKHYITVDDLRTMNEDPSMSKSDVVDVIIFVLRERGTKIG